MASFREPDNGANGRWPNEAKAGHSGEMHPDAAGNKLRTHYFFVYARASGSRGAARSRASAEGAGQFVSARLLPLELLVELVFATEARFASAEKLEHLAIRLDLEIIFSGPQWPATNSRSRRARCFDVPVSLTRSKAKGALTSKEVASGSSAQASPIRKGTEALFTFSISESAWSKCTRFLSPMGEDRKSHARAGGRVLEPALIEGERLRLREEVAAGEQSS